MAERAGYKHFMLKEIFEQPSAIGETLVGRISPGRGVVTLDELNLYTRGASRGRSPGRPRLRHELARRARRQVPGRGAGAHPGGSGLRIRISLSRSDRRPSGRWRSSSRSRAKPPIRSRRCAKRSARARASVAVCNVVGSMATREADGVIYTHVGPEIGVASTKAFTAQLVALYLLALHLAQVRGALTPDAAAAHFDALMRLPQLLEQALQHGAADRGARRALLHAQRLPLSRARHALPDRARGRAEAEGDLLHPRRGLSRRRDEARADRAHRRADAGGRDRAARRGVRENARQHPGGEGARRFGHRHRQRRR